MVSSKARTLVRQQWAGLIALFLVLTGGSAQALDGTDTVFSNDIVNGHVRTVDINPEAVTSNRVANETLESVDVAPDALTGNDVRGLTGADVTNNSLTGADVDEDTLVGGPTNPTGPAGGDLSGTYPEPEIADGAVGATEIGAGAVGSSELGQLLEIRDSASIPAMGGVGTVSAVCPNGWTALNGGGYFDFPSGDLSGSEAVANNGWRMSGQNNGTVAQDLHVEALCIQDGV